MLFLGLATVTPALLASPAGTVTWKSVGVTATLAPDGSLDITERHDVIYSGDWDFAQRRFAAGFLQKLDFAGVWRLNPSNATPVRLAFGSPDVPGRLSWVNSWTLRWRLPPVSGTAPKNREEQYIYKFRWRNILRRRNGVYHLDHDFAFPGRGGTIEIFTLKANLTPVWQAQQGFAPAQTAGPLAADQGFPVHWTLRYLPPGAPRGVLADPNFSVQYGIWLLLVIGTICLYLIYQLSENALGRFIHPTAPARIDEAWLGRHIFHLRPEEVSAIWSCRVGPAEAAALLTRLAAEEKLAVRPAGNQPFARDIMTARLLAPRSAFAGYERDLVEALLPGGQPESDTKHLRARTGVITGLAFRENLSSSIQSRPGFSKRSPSPSSLPIFAFGILSLVFLLVAMISQPEEIVLIIGFLFLGLLFWPLSLACGFWGRRVAGRKNWWLAGSLAAAWLPAVLLLVAAGTEWLPVTASFAAAAVLGALAALAGAFNLARARDGKERLARRLDLLAGRRFFRHELRQPRPRLRDSWLPWLLALGLAPQIERWSGDFGSTVSPGTGEDSWTGGRKLFGDVQATDWAAAVGNLAAAAVPPQ